MSSKRLTQTFALAWISAGILFASSMAQASSCEGRYEAALKPAFLNQGKAAAKRPSLDCLNGKLMETPAIRSNGKIGSGLGCPTNYMSSLMQMAGEAAEGKEPIIGAFSLILESRSYLQDRGSGAGEVLSQFYYDLGGRISRERIAKEIYSASRRGEFCGRSELASLEDIKSWLQKRVGSGEIPTNQMRLGLASIELAEKAERAMIRELASETAPESDFEELPGAL